MAFHLPLREQAIVFYLSFPLIFQLQYVSKEVIVTLFAVFLFAAFSFIKGWKLRAALAALALAVMAAEFREYYAISFAIANALWYIGQKAWRDPPYLTVAIVSPMVAVALFFYAWLLGQVALLISSEKKP